MNLMRRFLLTAPFLSLCKKAIGSDVETNRAIVAHRASDAKIYIGSPSILRLSDTHYLASHDEFGMQASSDKVFVYQSFDAGLTWELLSIVSQQYWSTLFLWDSNIYLIGLNKSLGTPSLRKSVDGGRNWTANSAFFNSFSAKRRFLTGSVPVLIKNGVLFRAFEEFADGVGWCSFVYSVTLGDDPMSATWRFSRGLSFPDFEESNGNKLKGWQEGNVVAAGDDNEIYNVLRVDGATQNEMAALVRFDHNLQLLSPPRLISLPGAGKKFCIRQHPRTKIYWSIVNFVEPGLIKENLERVRNALALVFSPDMEKWTVKKILIKTDNWKKVGYQYVDWDFKGEKSIVAAVRVSDVDERGRTSNQHDSNYLEFFEFSGMSFLSLTKEKL